MHNSFIDAMENAIREVKQWPEKTVHVFHHNDSDGLSSGAILTRAFERQGYTVERTCLEKPYPSVLKKIYEQEGRILIFADFAGRIAPMISDLNKGRNLTLILDHHVAEESTDPRVYNLDPDLFGLKGDRDISASTTCYLFAQTMDIVNRDMAYLAVLGAVGDGFFVEGQLVSQNREVALEAVKLGQIEIRKHGGGEEYLLTSANRQISCIEQGDYLDILGGVGYYKKGPDMGVKVCLYGVSPESDQLVTDLTAIRTKIFSEETARLNKGGLIKFPTYPMVSCRKTLFSDGGENDWGIL